MADGSFRRTRWDVGSGVSSMFGRARLKDFAPGEGSGPGQERTISPSLLPAGQIDAEQDHNSAGDLIDPQGLAEEHDARRDPDDGDEVLVDEHPIRPDATYPPLPSSE